MTMSPLPPLAEQATGIGSAASGEMPLAWQRELVRASGLFDKAAYLHAWPDLAATECDAIEHYLTEGWRCGADVGPNFSTSYYLDVNEDVRSANINPLIHYLLWGRAEGRQPLPPRLRSTATTATVQAVPSPVAPSDIEWELLAAAWPGAGAQPLVDVLVPVYRGFDETLRCLYSVLAASQITPYRLIVVDDCGPEPELHARLEWLAAHDLIELHRTPQNLGFVAACNLGMSLHPERDVILLNSDTEVFGNWLDRLRDAALRSPRTSTVTPFSNNATICSYPNFGQDNRLLLEIDDENLDRLTARVNAGIEIEIPTGVGFCMYILRACLDEVGLFDVKNFGRGYGEENDFCLRAAAMGWRNILAPDVFVRHYGGASFGTSKEARVQAALRVVERKHPGYLRMIGNFIRDDPIRPYREALDKARLMCRARKDAMLFITHTWGGGTERHVQDLSRLLEANGVPVFFCRIISADSGHLQIDDPLTPETPNLPLIKIDRDIDGFVKLVQQIGVVHLHIHHLAGFPEVTPDFFRIAAAAAGITYDVTLHDYIAICPRIHLVDQSGVYCGEPALSSCEGCVSRNGSPFGHPLVWHWRDRYHRLLQGARRVFVPSRDVVRRMQRHMPDVEYFVRPHLEPERSPAAQPKRPRLRPAMSSRRDFPTQRRIAVLGAMGQHKGSELLIETARVAVHRGLPLEFVVVGYTDRDAEMFATGNVRVTGPYEECDAVSKLVEVEADLVWFPAVWPETFSYTLSAAFRTRLPLVAFDFGAIAERIRGAGWGTLLPITLILDPEALAARLASLSLPKAEDVAAFRPPDSPTYPVPTASYYGFSVWPPAPQNVTVAWLPGEKHPL